MIPPNRYTNIHSHHSAESGVVSIKNIHSLKTTLSQPEYISIGIHPWHINEKKLNEEIDIIQKNAQNKNVLAIGECGLDKLIDTELSIQENIFKVQLEIAQQVQKPIIVHCVKAFDSLVRIKKAMNVNIPMIVHGFNNNEQIAKELIKNGFYLSFGKALLQENSNATKAIQLSSIDSIFLETDDADFDIAELYQKAAEIKEIPVEKLQEQISKNLEILNIQF